MYSFDYYKKYDPTFVDDLKKSHMHVLTVSKWLEKKLNTTVEINPLLIRPTESEMAKYSDSGDIIIDGNRCEVKQRFLEFTGKEDFPYKTIIVDVCHSWDKADPKPYAYFLTDKNLSCCVVVRGETFNLWTKVNKWDKFKRRNRCFYECPIDILKFHSMI